MSHVVYKATSILSHQRQDDGASSSFNDNGFDARLSAVSRFLGKYNFKTNGVVHARVAQKLVKRNI